MMEILGTVLTVIELLSRATPVIIQAGVDLKPFARDLFQKFKGKPATAEENAVLDAAVDELHARFQQPLPAAQEGDPDYVKPV